jgi:hypothetical protein
MPESWPESWLTPIDNYCERLGPGFRAELLNAATNGAFLAAALYALVLWRRMGATIAHSSRKRPVHA